MATKRAVASLGPAPALLMVCCSFSGSMLKLEDGDVSAALGVCWSGATPGDSSRGSQSIHLVGEARMR